MDGNLPKPSPSVENYYIGKGILSIAEFAGDTVGEYVDVGNCPRFEYELTEQNIEHENSRSRTREVDAEYTIRQGYVLNFALDEVSIKNLQIFLRATLSGTHTLYAGRDLTKRYALKFVSANSAGPDIQYNFWKCKLTPNGAFPLIGDDYALLSFSGKGLADNVNQATSPLITAVFATTTTSA